MAKKKISLEKVGPAGDAVSVTMTLEDDTLGAGDRTSFFVTLKREDGPATKPLTIWIIPVVGTSALNLYPPFKPTGNGRMEGLESGESRRIHFLIDNNLEGASPATYNLLCVIQWDQHAPFVLPVFSVP